MPAYLLPYLILPFSVHGLLFLTHKKELSFFRTALFCLSLGKLTRDKGGAVSFFRIRCLGRLNFNVFSHTMVTVIPVSAAVYHTLNPTDGIIDTVNLMMMCHLHTSIF